MVGNLHHSTIGRRTFGRSIAFGEDRTALARHLGQEDQQPLLVRHLAFHADFVDELEQTDSVSDHERRLVLDACMHRLCEQLNHVLLRWLVQTLQPRHVVILMRAVNQSFSATVQKGSTVKFGVREIQD